MVLADLWQTWPMFDPWQIRAGQHRANNVVQIIDTRGGGTFALRVYRHQRDIQRIRYEHALVTQLQTARLPFIVPLPMPTSSGETTVSVPTDEGSLFASLWPLAPGSAPQEGDLQQIHAAGQALGVLDHALAKVEITPSPDVTPPARHGDLAHVHRVVPDPMEAIADLPIDAGSKVRACRCSASLPHLAAVDHPP
jgi:homoserine kinase type II